MEKLKNALAMSIGVNIAALLVVAVYVSITKDSLREVAEYKRYMAKMMDMMTAEQLAKVSEYAHLNIEFQNIINH